MTISSFYIIESQFYFEIFLRFNFIVFPNFVMKLLYIIHIESYVIHTTREPGASQAASNSSIFLRFFSHRKIFFISDFEKKQIDNQRLEGMLWNTKIIQYL